PSHFCLQDLTSITAPVFEFKLNPNQEAAWAKTSTGFLSHRFDAYAGMSFPDADTDHLDNCIAFFLWAFSFDDVSDEGVLQSNPEGVKRGVDISLGVLHHPDAPPPDFSYAAMLHEYVQLYLHQIPTVMDFIVLRRQTIGGPIVEAMVEYSLDLQIPEHVWDHPILDGLSKAAIDIMTWPNDLCSFNKEQSDGDFQNLVFCIMLERDCDLQAAVDILTGML
ncbi:hypothetical protein CERSUDRAFT_24251, partial [Gelatoporia subvermispora B]